MKKLIVLVFLLATGCNCPSMQEIKVPVAVSKKDMFMSCKMLRDERRYSEAMLEHNLAREDILDAYAVYPVCYPFAEQRVEKAIEAYQQRISYLTDLIENRKCPK